MQTQIQMQMQIRISAYCWRKKVHLALTVHLAYTL